MSWKNSTYSSCKKPSVTFLFSLIIQKSWFGTFCVYCLKAYFPFICFQTNHYLRESHPAGALKKIHFICGQQLLDKYKTWSGEIKSIEVTIRCSSCIKSRLSFMPCLYNSEQKNTSVWFSMTSVLYSNSFIFKD